jgi:protoporphyrinogen oxidase
MSTASTPTLPGEIAVIGGGIGGLAAAYRLTQLGTSVTLYEASDQLGGLGTFFAYRTVQLERFYHCMLPSDHYLLALLAELGLDSEVYWKQTSFGFMTRGAQYALNSPLDLLRFKPLPFVSRLRVGATGLWGRLCSSRGLDDITCVEWLTRLSGRKAFETFWRPMLQAKFGERYHEVPALWFWTRFNREKGSGPERKGYIRGGYKRIIDTLAARLGEHGARLHLNATVQRLDLDEQGRVEVTAGSRTRSFDRVLITAPAFFLEQATAGGRLASIASRADAGIDIQGVINAVFMLRRPLTRHYWVAAIDDDVPFQGVIESTNLLDLADTAGEHLVYVMNYVHRSEPVFSRPDDVILGDYLDGLRRLFPDLRCDDITDRFLFRSAFVEPLYTTGYLRRQPPAVLWPARIYLANTTQVYPEVTSWNGAVGSIERLLQRIRAGE